MSAVWGRRASPPDAAARCGGCGPFELWAGKHRAVLFRVKTVACVPARYISDFYTPREATPTHLPALIHTTLSKAYDRNPRSLPTTLAFLMRPWLMRFGTP